MENKDRHIICTTQEELDELEAFLSNRDGIEKAKEHIELVKKRVTIVSREERDSIRSEAALICGDTSNFADDISATCDDCGKKVFHTKMNQDFTMKLCMSCAAARRGDT